MRFILLIATSLMVSCGADVRTAGINSSLERKSFMRSIVEVLSGEKTFFNSNKSRNESIDERGSDAGRSQARVYLTQKFEAMGLETEEQRFYRGINLIAERPASPNAPIIIIGAHYDSVGNAGADDNASGVAAMMTIAEKIAAENNQDITYRFIAFDKEEKGLLGSKAYVNGIRDQDEIDRIKGAFTLDMIGYDGNGDGAFHSVDCGRRDSMDLTEATLDAIETNNIPLNWVDACSKRSDHGSFWQAGIPAIVVSQNFFGGDANFCYHQGCDTIDKINFDYVGNITDAMEMGIRLYTNSL